MTVSGQDLRPPRRHHRRAVAALPTVALLLAGLLGLVGATLPSRVLPADVAGDRVELEPPAVRVAQGPATVDLLVGTDVPDDVVVAFSLRAATPDRAGRVVPGDEVADASVTRGGRVRPGERLRATLTTDVPTLLVAEVRPVRADGEEPTTLSALVLPGAAGAVPEVSLEADDDGVTGRVAVARPLLVSLRLDAAASTVLADRLVLPGQPLVVDDAGSRWLQPVELVVTDELGRTVRATRRTGALVALATGLLLLAASAAVVGRRRR